MVSDKLKQTIREAVREGIDDALTKYGIDTDDPNSMQHDMLHLRKSRIGSEELTKWAKRSAITVAISSILATLWSAIKQAINGG
ncbi:MAG: hypothetical protein WBJ81_05760 [Rickettsiales bacterium]